MSVQDPQKVTSRFAPVELIADVSTLPKSERSALVNILEAAKIMDLLFLRQVWAGNESLLLDLSQDRSLGGGAQLHAFLLNKGPWDRLEHNQPFLRDVPEKPASANFYPANGTKAEIEAWLRSLSGGQREAASGFFTTIRRKPDGTLQPVPYSIEYQGELERAAGYLRNAAKQTAQPTLKRFLLKRADALLNNDYYESDIAWMELDSSIEPALGPYEVYEDEWFNAKAAFEAFVTLRDDAETKKLAKFSQYLQEIEDHLPIDAAIRNLKLGNLRRFESSTRFLARAMETGAFKPPRSTSPMMSESPRSAAPSG